MATYNGERFIKKQIESILKQLDINDEIIVSDDSSTDTTLEILSTIMDQRIKIFAAQKYRNLIFNFENAMKLAKGDLIFLSDQDDIWFDGKISRLTEELVNFDMVVSDHSLIDEEDVMIEPSYFLTAASGKGIIKNLIKNNYFGCCMAFKKEILSLALPFPRDIPMHDMWLGMVADLFFKVKFIDVTYVAYRKHSNNSSSATNFKSDNSLLKKISFRINLLKYMPILLFRKLKSNRIK